MFTTATEAIDGHIRALLFKVPPLLFHSGGRGRGVGSDPSSQGLLSLVGGWPDGREMPAGPRGQQVW